MSGNSRSATAAIALVASSLAPAPARGAEPPPASSSAATTTTSTTAPDAATTDAATSEPVRSPDEIPGLVFGAVALGALATGAVFGVLAWQDHEEFVASPSNAIADRGQLRALLADMCFSGALSFGLVSAVLLVRPPADDIGEPPPAPKPRVAISPFFSGQGGGAAAVLRW